MVSTKKFSEFTNGGDIENSNITVGLESGANAQFNNPWTFLPPGSTGDRPIPAANMYYRLRFNTTLEIYEYYDPTIPIWVELSGSGTGTVNPGVANDIAFYAASGQAVSPIASAIHAVLVSNGTGVPSMSTTLPIGLTIPSASITSSTASLTSGSVIAAPSAGTDLVNKTYADSLFGSGVTSLTGTTNQISFSSPTGAITASLPQDIALGSTPTFAGMTLTSIPLNVSSGGTGVSSVTTSPTATAFAGWNSNLNLRSNNFLPNLSSTASSGGTLVLTVASAEVQEITGALTHTVQMPTETGLTTGHPFTVINNSSGNVTLNSSGGNLILTMAANTTAYLTCVNNAVTTAAAWNASYIFDLGGGVTSITGTANQIIASASTGNITLSTPQNIGTASSPTFNGLTVSGGSLTLGATQAVNSILTDTTMAAAADTNLYTGLAVKTYISTLLSSWVAYTPTFTGFGTVSNVEIWSRRVGNTLEIRGRFTGGTTTATEARMTLGYNGTNANVNSSGTAITSIQLCGQYALSGTGAANFCTLIESNVGYITFSLQNSGRAGLTKVNGDVALTTGVTMSLFCFVPVTTWP